MDNASPSSVFFNNEDHHPCPLNIDAIARIVQLAILPEYAEREIAITCLSAAEIKNLNTTYREKNKPTNVLSFPYEGFDAFESIEALQADFKAPLGEILLCPEVIEREATEESKTFSDHFTHLLIHGTLHLQGFDHETPEEAAIMEKCEIELLHTLGIQNPYDA
jgi:probable rRNA maturation factor